ncbi:MAG: hypothetical protein QXS38_01425 [Candidatus Pacearchaeota archaeon]
MNVTLIIIFVLVALLIFIKFGEIKHKYLLRIFLLLVIFFLGTLGYVFIKHNIDLTTYEGFLQLGRTYLSWLSSIFHNVKGITGYAIQQQWGLNSSAAIAS